MLIIKVYITRKKQIKNWEFIKKVKDKRPMSKKPSNTGFSNVSAYLLNLIRMWHWAGI